MNSKIECECIVKDDDKIIGTSYCFLTSVDLMNDFLENKITERELLFASRKNKKYETCYLSGVIVLPEHRSQGVGINIIRNSLQHILKENRLKFIFGWIFSEGGEKILRKISEEFMIPHKKILR